MEGREGKTLRLKDRRPLSRRSDPDAGVLGVAVSPRPPAAPRAGVRYPAAAAAAAAVGSAGVRRCGDGVRRVGGARRRLEGGRRPVPGAEAGAPPRGGVAGDAAATWAAVDRDVCGGERGGVAGGGVLVRAAAAQSMAWSGLPGRECFQSLWERTRGGGGRERGG